MMNDLLMTIARISRERNSEQLVVRKEIEQPKDTSKLLKKSIIIIKTLFFCMIVLFSFILLDSYVDLQLNTSFNQKLNAIAPYISEQEEKTLKSKWALMQNRRDFEIIQANFTELSKKYHTTLPKDLL